MSFIIIQLLGIFAWLIDVTSYWFESKKQIILTQIIADLFFIFHYFLLGASVGCATCTISLVIDVCFYFIKTKNQEKLLYNVFIPIYLIIGIFVANSFVELFPILASITYCYTLTMSAEYVIVGGIIDASYWIIYNIISGSYVGAVTDLIVIVSNWLSLRNRQIVTIKSGNIKIK